MKQYEMATYRTAYMPYQQVRRTHFYEVEKGALRLTEKISYIFWKRRL